MPRGKHIRIVIAADGSCSVDAMNFVGPSCQAATSEIAAALGGQVVSDRLKPEARLRERAAQRGRESAT